MAGYAAEASEARGKKFQRRLEWLSPPGRAWPAQSELKVEHDLRRELLFAEELAHASALRCELEAT